MFQCSFGVGVSAALSGLEQLFSSIYTPSPPSLFFILLSTDLISVDGCLEWRLMAGLQGFNSHGGSILTEWGLAGNSETTFHLSKAAVINMSIPIWPITLLISSVKAFATTSVCTGPGQTRVTPILCSFTSILRVLK